MTEISEELKNKDIREFLTASVNLLRDSKRDDLALSLLFDFEKMEERTNDFNRDEIICRLFDVFINKSL